MEIVEVPQRRARTSNEIPPALQNPADRKTIVLQAPPYEDYLTRDVITVISHNCMDGWNTTAVTWADAPPAYKDRAWSDFLKRFTWDPSIDAKVREMYTIKAAERVKDHFHKARDSAKRKAEALHPGHAEEHMKSFPPWWTSRDIWTEMCVKWQDEKWKKKSTVASANRSVGSAPGGRTLGTYRGGPKSQGHYVLEKQAQTADGQEETWTDVFASLRVNIPGVKAMQAQYETSMAAKYPEGTPRPRFDKDVWTTASGGVKRGYVKGIGLKRSRPSSFTAASATSSVHRSTATSAAPTPPAINS